MDAKLAESFAEKKTVLVSRVPHPTIVPYGTGHIRLGARGVSKPLTARLVGKLPIGVMSVKR